MVECLVCYDFNTFETSKLSQQYGGVNYDEIIEKIIDKSIDKKVLVSVDLDKITKNTNYKKLDQKNKDLVYNTINHYNEKQKEEKSNKKINMSANGVCNNCLNKTEIKPQTLICKTIINNKIDIELSKNSGYDIIELDNTLPRTVDYICPNDKCETRKNSKIKEAVIFRESYKMTYKCVVCKEIWN